jgi:ketopantoate reductase
MPDLLGFGPDGRILHLSDTHTSFGEQNGARSERRAEIVSALSGANFVTEISDNIL